MFNFWVSLILVKTLSIVAESVLSLSGLYFFIELKPKFDKTIALMTAAITLVFSIRSSSPVGWLPLALFLVSQGPDRFHAILKAGLVVTFPLIGATMFEPTWPQFIFLYTTSSTIFHNFSALDQTTFTSMSSKVSSDKLEF